MKRFIYSVIVAVLAVSCMGVNETEPNAFMRPEAGGINVTGDNSLYFTFSSNVSGSGRLESCGFYYGKNSDLSGAQKLEVQASSDSFSETVLVRDYGSSYYVCSFITNGIDEIRSEVKSFSVGNFPEYVKFQVPTLDSYKPSSMEAKVSVGYAVSNGVEISEMGLCYGETESLSVDGTHVKAEKIGGGYYSVVLSGLQPGKQYYMRPYLKDGANVAYGAAAPLNVYSTPEVKTAEVKDITDKSARLCGEVTDDCGKEITERGFVLAEGDVKPDMNSSKLVVSGTVGSYELTIEGLQPNTLYSVRAFASNQEGTAYGDVVNFTTKVAMSTVVTEKVTDVTTSTAVVHAKVSYTGGEELSSFGILLGTSKEVNPENSRKIVATGSASYFTVSLKELSRKTKYYVKAYATNSVGTSYGSVVEFETKAELPVVATADISEITDVSAVSGGDVTDDGGDEIKARGVVWGTFENLTLDNAARTSDGKGKGQFVSNISGLKYETAYYVRAYATNSAGTSYGDAVKFTTKERDLSRVTDLSTGGTANSYIVSEPGMYMIPTVKGNSRESVGNVASVETLWESFGTVDLISVGDLVNNVSLSGGYAVFQVPSPFREGNAVIAAKDASGKILWSWHIWLTDQPEEQVYYNHAGVMMDRNLGAVSATPGNVGSLGLLYQWGRKDPFLGSASVTSRMEPASTGTWVFNGYSTQQTGTIQFAIENPMTLIYNTELNEDWLYTGSTAVDNSRWQSDKTIYDPCPAGWRVPDGGDDGIWAKAYRDDAVSFDHVHKGVNFSGYYGDASSIWYPSAGNRGPGSELYDVAEMSAYWSVTPVYNSSNVWVMDFTTNFYMAATQCFRAMGASVRCMKIPSEYGGNTEGVGGSDYEW